MFPDNFSWSIGLEHCALLDALKITLSLMRAHNIKLKYRTLLMMRHNLSFCRSTGVWEELDCTTGYVYAVVIYLSKYRVSPVVVVASQGNWSEVIPPALSIIKLTKIFED